MYELFLVNHTQKQYVKLCNSDFSQERVRFIFPMMWETSDQSEIMTEFVFREALKHHRKYELVSAFPDPPSSEEEPESDEENVAREKAKSVTRSRAEIIARIKAKYKPPTKKVVKEEDAEDEEDEEDEEEEAEEDDEDDEEEADELEIEIPVKPTVEILKKDLKKTEKEPKKTEKEPKKTEKEPKKLVMP